MYQSYVSQQNQYPDGGGNVDNSTGGAMAMGRPRESPRPTGSAGGGPPIAGRRYNQQQQQPVSSRHGSSADLYNDEPQQQQQQQGYSGGGGGAGPVGNHYNSRPPPVAFHQNSRLITPTQHNKYGPQLRMSIVQCSSEDDSFPVSELSCRTSYTSGWHSAKNPEYPQELGFRFEGEVDLQSVRVLCHESKIPTRIEVFVAEATDEDRRAAQFPTYEAAVFRRLGHFNLNSNVENGFAARELKTVNVRKHCLYLKLIIRKNHINNINVFHQVSIVALAAHGILITNYRLPPGISTKNEILIAGDDEVPMEQIYISKKRPPQQPGSASNKRSGAADSNPAAAAAAAGYPPPLEDPQQTTSSPTAVYDDDGFDCTFGGTMDATTGARVRELSQHKARAVEEEDYDLAKALKDQIELLKDYGSQIALLEARKDVAVDAEDYGTAKELKKQIDALRAKGSNRSYGTKVPVGAPPQPSNANATNNRPFPARQSAQQQHEAGHQSAAVAGGAPSWLDEKPVGGGGAGVPFDEKPVGGGGAKQPKAFVPFDERPVGGGGGGGGGMGGGAGGMNSSQPSSQAPTPRQPPPKRAPVRANRPPSPPPQEGPNGERYEQVTATFISSGNDEVAIGVGSGPKEDGGIVDTSSAPRGPVVKATGADLPEWEAAFNGIVEASCQGAQSGPEALPAAKLTELKEYVAVFGQYATSCLLSKQWQLREGALRAVVSQAGYPILVEHRGSDSEVLTTLLHYAGAKGLGVHDNLANVFFALGDALKLIVSRELVPRPPAASQFASSLTPLLPELMSKAGDNNARVRDQAASVLMAFAASSLGADKISAIALADPPAVGKKPVSFRVQLARLGLIHAILDEFGLQEKGGNAAARGGAGIPTGGSGLTVDAIMNRVCLPSLQHSHQDVREAAQQLIAALHHKSKQPIQKYLADIKAQQRALIEELIEKYVTPDKGAAVAQKKPAPTTAADPSPLAAPRAKPAKSTEPEMVSSSLSVGKAGYKEMVEAARVASADGAPQPPSSAKKRDPKKTCQFCNHFDERFTDDIMDLHYVQSCPMLCPCPLCGQVTEISQLQTHLTTECDRKTLVKQCPRCLEAVRAEDLAAHVEAKECINVELKKFSLCPLCHAKLAPGQPGWEAHLASAPGCPNNPRRYDGGNGEEFEL